MYAIVEMAGQQFKVAKDQKVYVHRLQTEEGKKVTFDNVLLLDDGKNITIGAPAIDGAAVEAKVIKHLKGDKVIVFKKKRRKGYSKKNGHRQSLTEIVIESIVSKGAKKAEPKKEAKPPKEKAEGKAAPVEVSVASKAKAEKAAPKKSAAKGDDLKKIEGIGPKAAEALTNAGIGTYAKLAKAEPDNIKEILTEASSRMAHLDPTTWPQQAQLAADGKWDELKKLQDELNGGK
ncbi:50S ribosomal protein L21 [Kriegella aquimaris]|uniref:Large ribosomal subunit protein bL21 n=1 Tax=Kriegella aquimaris TaxID=192904 RepID=A0A1G9M2M1_9FLAO|nr:50S ribosomal protein L21 [Kriegella aquimaris]SDL68404.1 LSU ribosomal protein L21P [Kriegella aquimaris]